MKSRLSQVQVLIITICLWIVTHVHFVVLKKRTYHDQQKKQLTELLDSSPDLTRVRKSNDQKTKSYGSLASYFRFDSVIKPKKLLIVAEFRTGSTVVSEIFNNHPEVFYFYEPMSVLRNAQCYDLSRSTIAAKKEILTNFLDNCEIPDPEKYIKNFEKSPNIREQQGKCLISAGAS